jgi:transcriptional regulator with XRE-family HTH domain
MKTEHSGGSSGTFIKAMSVSWQRSADANAATSTFRRTIEPSAKAGEWFAMPISTERQGPVFSVALSATLQDDTALRRRIPKWSNPQYRRAYAVASIEQGLAWQIRVNRQVRGLSQAELAAAIGTKQSAISRLEDPSYGSHSLDTLIAIADVFDCALSVRFVPYSELARQSEDLSPEALIVEPFAVEEQEHS